MSHALPGFIASQPSHLSSFLKTKPPQINNILFLTSLPIDDVLPRQSSGVRLTTSLFRYSARPVTGFTSFTRTTHTTLASTPPYTSTSLISLPQISLHNIRIPEHACTSTWLCQYPTRKIHLSYLQHRQRSRKTLIQQEILQQREP